MNVVDPRAPHRGGVILALGILSIVCCCITGIVALVMAKQDLRDMRANVMDPSGEGLTKAGRICAIVGVCLWAAYLVLYGVIILVALYAERNGFGKPG